MNVQFMSGSSSHTINDSSDYTNDEKMIIAVLGLVSGALSFIGACAIIVMYSLQHMAKTHLFYQRLVLYLTISDALWIGTITINQIWYLYDGQWEYPSVAACTVSGFIQQWFEVASDFWITIMSLYMYLKIVHKVESKYKEWLFHILAWGVPLAIAIIPLFKSTDTSYGPTGPWCWIEQAELRMFFSYLFTWVAFLTIIVTYALIIRYIRCVQRDMVKYGVDMKKTKTYKGLFRKLCLYPLFFLIQWTPATLRRFMNIGGTDNFVIVALTIMALNSAGIINAVLYGGIIYRPVFPTVFPKRKSTYSPADASAATPVDRRRNITYVRMPDK